MKYWKCLSALSLLGITLVSFQSTAAEPVRTTPLPHPSLPIITKPTPPLPLPVVQIPAICKSECYYNISKVWFATHDGKGAVEGCTNENRAADMNVPCGAYACNTLNGRCIETCNDPSQCAPGNACVWGVCKMLSYSCDAHDLNKLVGTDGKSFDCAPYKCQGSACLKMCATSEDCAYEHGFICDVPNRLCVNPHP